MNLKVSMGLGADWARAQARHETQAQIVPGLGLGHATLAQKWSPARHERACAGPDFDCA